MKRFIEDATLSLILRDREGNGIIKQEYPELTDKQRHEIAHFVFHKINLNNVYDEAIEEINKYVVDKKML